MDSFHVVVFVDVVAVVDFAVAAVAFVALTYDVDYVVDVTTCVVDFVVAVVAAAVDFALVVALNTARM